MTAKCKELQTHITSYIDGELDLDKKTVVRKHLKDCHVCHDRYLGEVRLKELVQDKAGTLKAPPYLNHRIRRQLLRNGNRPGFWEILHSLFVYQPVGASLALAVIFIAILLPVFGSLDSTYLGLSMDGDFDDGGKLANLTGEIVCMDCEFMTGVEGDGHDEVHHRAGLKEQNDTVWTFLYTGNLRELLHDETVLKKRATVRGRIFKNSRYIQVTDYELL